MSERTPSARVVLYADDDPDDRMLLSMTFNTVAPDVIFESVPDGFKALDYLEGRKEQLPCLLILDLNMPGMSGKEVMRRLKASSEFSSLPIVVFTTSANPADKAEFARLGVAMITKPFDPHELTRTASDKQTKRNMNRGGHMNNGDNGDKNNDRGRGDKNNRQVK